MIWVPVTTRSRRPKSKRLGTRSPAERERTALQRIIGTYRPGDPDCVIVNRKSPTLADGLPYRPGSLQGGHNSKKARELDFTATTFLITES